MSDAFLGCGALLQYGNAATWEDSTSWTSLAGITTMTGPSRTRSDVEITNLSSPSCRREYISGLEDGGNINATLLWTENAYETCLSLMGSDNVKGWRVVFPDADVATDSKDNVNAYISVVDNLTFNPDQPITFNITLRVTGDEQFVGSNGS